VALRVQADATGVEDVFVGLCGERALQALGDVVLEAGVADLEVDGFVVVHEVRGETALGRDVAVLVRAQVLGVGVRPRRPNRLPDAGDAVLALELVGAVGVVAPQQDVLRQVDVEAVDGVEAQRHVAVHPDLADGHRHLVVDDRVQQRLDAVDGGVAVHARR